MANCPISGDIGCLDEQTGHKFTIMGAWCVMYNKFLIGWVAVQYHWILDESVPYLGGSEGRAKYKQDESNVQ